MSWIGVAAAASVAGGVAGGVQANQNRQRQKGIIGRAYAQGQQRLALGQQDTRQSFGEGLLARGLGGGGGVRDTGPVGVDGGTNVTRAHDLGSQGVADLQREQGLEQRGLLTARDTTLSDVNAAATAGEVSSVAGGISGALATYGNRPFSMGAGPMPATTTPGMGTPGAALGGSANDRYPGAAFGVDPMNPLGRGAWGTGSSAGSTGMAGLARTNADFNVVNG